MNPSNAPLDPWLVRLLLLAGVLSLLLRMGVAASFPITGDEAFFYSWSTPPDWGSADHPPMVAWWMALMRSLFGAGTFALRLPAVLLPLGVGAAMWWGLKDTHRERAAWAVALFWLTPVSVLNMMITTDTPLILWSALSIAAVLRAEARPALDATARWLYAASGALWTLAFLSKYFAIVLALAYLVYFFAFRRDRLAGLALMVLCALPGPVINIAYNWGHCWTNVMFNLINRNAGEAFALRKPGLYALTIAYLATPAVLWVALRQRAALWSFLRSVQPTHRVLACVVLIPLAFFALISLRKVVGLHWVLSFYPFAFALLALALPREALKPCAKGMAAFALLHVIVVAGLYAISLDNWKDSRYYPNIIRSWRTAQMLEQVKAPGVVLMSNAFTPSSIYGYVQGDYMPSFGVGNFHARQDDVRVDFSIYNGKTIRVIRTDKPEMGDYTPYFASTQLLSFQQDGATFYAVEGKGFDYAAYKAGVLQEINRRYYRIPAWLPVGECGFCRRLCGEDRCAP